MRIYVHTYQGHRWFYFQCPACKTPHVVGESWVFNDNIEKPTFAPSIKVTSHDGKVCHSFVRDGMIEFLSDCTHNSAGKTIALENIPMEQFHLT